MKYILMCIAALAVCVCVAILATKLIAKKVRMKRFFKVMSTTTIALVIMLAVSLGYLSIYYHADSTANISVDKVHVGKIKGGYFFDGPGEDTALIFYQGAKVDALAYAPLMTSLAENGIDCFLADIPFRIAMLGSNIADEFMSAYSYDTWIAAGHSMGGLVISNYAAAHADQIDSLVLLGSYPGCEIPDCISLYSIYGTEDGCLNRDAYEEAKKFWPSDSYEYAIEGGNHAQYANYGPQSGDLEPTITAKEQQDITVNIILKIMSDEDM